MCPFSRSKVTTRSVSVDLICGIEKTSLTFFISKTRRKEGEKQKIQIRKIKEHPPRLHGQIFVDAHHGALRSLGLSLVLKKERKKENLLKSFFLSSARSSPKRPRLPTRVTRQEQPYVLPPAPPPCPPASLQGGFKTNTSGECVASSE